MWVGRLLVTRDTFMQAIGTNNDLILDHYRVFIFITVLMPFTLRAFVGAIELAIRNISRATCRPKLPPWRTGLSIDAVLHARLDWKQARLIAGYEKMSTAVTVALARLVLVHLLQPAVYFMVLSLYFKELTPIQQWFGMLVATRETIYIVLSLGCMLANPAFLLCDTLATWFHREKRYVAVYFMVVFVFSPEKYVFLALVSGLSERLHRVRTGHAKPPAALAESGAQSSMSILSGGTDEPSGRTPVPPEPSTAPLHVRPPRARVAPTPTRPAPRPPPWLGLQHDQRLAAMQAGRWEGRGVGGSVPGVRGGERAAPLGRSSSHACPRLQERSASDRLGIMLRTKVS
jgi:hypothetical protein